MRTAFRIAAGFLLSIGGGLATVGVFALAFAWFTPLRPTPSLNEGHGLAELLGQMMVFVGSISLVVGVAMRAGLKSASTTDELIQHEHARKDRRLF